MHVGEEIESRCPGEHVGQRSRSLDSWLTGQLLALCLIRLNASQRGQLHKHLLLFEHFASQQQLSQPTGIINRNNLLTGLHHLRVQSDFLEGNSLSCDFVFCLVHHTVRALSNFFDFLKRFHVTLKLDCYFPGQHPSARCLISNAKLARLKLTATAVETKLCQSLPCLFYTTSTMSRQKRAGAGTHED